MSELQNPVACFQIFFDQELKFDGRAHRIYTLVLNNMTLGNFSTAEQPIPYQKAQSFSKREQVARLRFMVSLMEKAIHTLSQDD